IDDPVARAELMWAVGGFGSRVYGLFRADALERCGVLRTVYLPDRLLLVELALHGTFREVREVLWYRRTTGTPSFERQREAFFPGRPAPASFDVPWPDVHAAALLWSLGVEGSALPALSRERGAAFALRYQELARALVAERAARTAR